MMVYRARTLWSLLSHPSHISPLSPTTFAPTSCEAVEIITLYTFDQMMATRLTTLTLHRRAFSLHGRATVRLVSSSSSSSSGAAAAESVERFLENIRLKSIDSRIVHQQVPDLLLSLLQDNESPQTGPVVTKVLNEIREDTMTAKIYALVSCVECVLEYEVLSIYLLFFTIVI